MQWGNYLGAKGPAAFLLPVSRSSSCGRKRGTKRKSQGKMHSRRKPMQRPRDSKGHGVWRRKGLSGRAGARGGRGPYRPGGQKGLHHTQGRELSRPAFAKELSVAAGRGHSRVARAGRSSRSTGKVPAAGARPGGSVWSGAHAGGEEQTPWPHTGPRPAPSHRPACETSLVF